MSLPKNASRNIQFWLPEPYLGELQRRAEALSTTLGPAARGVLLAALEEQRSLEVLDSISRLEEGLRGLRQDLARTLVHLLLNITEGRVDREKLIAWVDVHLGSGDSSRA